MEQCGFPTTFSCVEMEMLRGLHTAFRESMSHNTGTWLDNFIVTFYKNISHMYYNSFAVFMSDRAAIAILLIIQLWQ